MPALPTQQGRLVLPGGVDYVRRYGVVEHWSGNEASGARLASISSANDMTAVNAPTSNPGNVYGLARQYTAASSMYHSLADNAAVSSGDVDFWVSVWFYVDSLSAPQVLATKGIDVAGITQEWGLWLSAALQVEWSIGYGGTQRTIFNVTPIATGAWNHALGIHDSANDQSALYVNAAAAVTGVVTGGPADTSAAVRIGTDGGAGRFFDGRIGPVAFGKSPPLGIAALKTEIRDRLHNSGAGRAYPWR